MNRDIASFVFSGLEGQWKKKKKKVKMQEFSTNKNITPETFTC